MHLSTSKSYSQCTYHTSYTTYQAKSYSHAPIYLLHYEAKSYSHAPIIYLLHYDLHVHFELCYNIVLSTGHACGCIYT